MRATGRARTIIRKVTDIQALVGNAKSAIQNDRDAFRMDKAIPALEQALNLCYEITAMYDRIEETADS